MVSSTSTSISAEIRNRRTGPDGGGAATAFLVLDTESIPDGDLIRRVKYPGETLTVEEAIARAQADARDTSVVGSDFLPVTFQVPIAICVLRLAADFTIQALTALDDPQFRTEEMVRGFWRGVTHYKPRLVTFNGRGFDLPLLELAAFRYGCPANHHFSSSRHRFQGNHLDLFDWLSNFGACRLNGGLNLLAKLLGLPGKMDVAGDQVYSMYQAGQLRAINDYCLCDTLDTYFVFLRTRVLLGELSPEMERVLVHKARHWIESRVQEIAPLQQYLDHWAR